MGAILGFSILPMDATPWGLGIVPLISRLVDGRSTAAATQPTPPERAAHTWHRCLESIIVHQCGCSPHYGYSYRYGNCSYGPRVLEERGGGGGEGS